MSNFENVEGTIQFHLIEPNKQLLILHCIKIDIWNKFLRHVNKNSHYFYFNEWKKIQSMPYALVCFQEEAVLHTKYWFYKWEQPDECMYVL